MPIKARLADGTVLQFPDNTDPAVIDRTVQAHIAETTRKDRAYKAGGGTFGGMTNRLADNFTFGLADDVAGVASVIGNAIAAPLSDKVDFDPRAAFNRGKQDFKDSIERSGREAPVGSALAGALGFVGSLATPTRALAGAPTLRAGAALGARQGAVTGALGGVGASDGNLGERAASAGAGAALGSGIGAGVGVAVPVAGRMARNAAQSVRSMAGRGPSVAPRLIADALEADGLTGRAAGQMIDEAQARGVPMVLADAGDNLRGLASSVGRQPGPSRTIVRDMAISRQQGQADRIASAVARDLGPVANPRKVSEQLIAKAKTDAAPLYDEAYAAPMPIMDDMQALLKRIPNAAVENAKRVARLEGRDPNTLGVDFDAAGDIVLTGKPTVETLDFIKRGLDDVVEKYRDKTTGALVLDGEGRAVNNLLRDFVAEIDRVNPAYAAARAAYAGPVRAAAALKKGEAFTNKTADDIVAETERMTPFELDQYRLGVRAAMTRQIDAKGDWADKVSALIGTPKKRKALEKLFGGQGDFERFMATLGDENRAALTFKDVATGSPTAPRLADDALTGDTGLTEAAGNAIVTGMSGRPITALINALGEARRYGVGETGKITRAEVAAALSEADPLVLREALRLATRARANVRAGIRATNTGEVQGRVGGQGGRAILSLKPEPERVEQ